MKRTLVDAYHGRKARQRRKLHCALAAGLLLVIGQGGCALFAPPEEPRPPQTVSEFVKLPRPGNGALGP